MEGVSARGDGWTIFDEYRFAGLSPYESLVYELYWRLDTERLVSDGGPRPIPRSKCDAELDKLGISDTLDGDNMQYLWDQIERVHLKCWSYKLRKAADPKLNEKDPLDYADSPGIVI